MQAFYVRIGTPAWTKATNQTLMDIYYLAGIQLSRYLAQMWW